MSIVANAIVAGMIIALPAGIGLAFWNENAEWLWLSGAALLLIYAG